MNHIPYHQHVTITLKAELASWRMKRIKNFASKTNRTLEEALLYIKERCGEKILATAVDEIINEIDEVVDPEFRSNNEPVFINHKKPCYGSKNEGIAKD